MYSSTSKFTSLMDSQGIKYSYQGIRERTKSEVVEIRYSGDNMNTITVQFFFSEDCKNASIRVFDMMRVPNNKLANILLEINKQNNYYRYAKFCLDTNDNTVQAEMDAVFRGYDVAEICVELLKRMVNIVDEAYPEFMKAIYA